MRKSGSVEPSQGQQNLASIKGIGKITGAILLSVIGDMNDFQQALQLRNAVHPS